MTSTIPAPIQLNIDSQIHNNANGNNFTETGFYFIGTTSANLPAGFCTLLVFKGPTFTMQMLVRIDALYTRRMSNGTWDAWKGVPLS